MVNAAFGIVHEQDDVQDSKGAGLWFYMVGPILLYRPVQLHSSLAPERLRSASSAETQPCASATVPHQARTLHTSLLGNDKKVAIVQ